MKFFNDGGINSILPHVFFTISTLPTECSTRVMQEADPAKKKEREKERKREKEREREKERDRERKRERHRERNRKRKRREK